MNDYEAKHLEQLRAYLPECTVLLKKNGAFPLEKAGRIALYGSGARRTLKGGTGSGEVNSRFFVTAEEGLEAAGFTVVTKAWLDAYEAVRAKALDEFRRFIMARAKAKHTNFIIEGMGAVMPEPEYELPLDVTEPADAAVYVLSRICGEGNDRQAVAGDFMLSETEIRDIMALDAAYDKFMLVLNVGAPVDLSPVNSVGNILVLSQLGAETGAALADLLLGKTCPSGKLATGWCTAAQLPAVGEFGDRDETRYKEGVYVGYRYFDSVGEKPLYPFGFGLSYTDFSLSDVGFSLRKGYVTVNVKVTNTGAFSGKETVQLYACCPDGRLGRPARELAAFAKTAELQPGASEKLELSCALRDLAAYDEANACWLLEKGDYVFRLGTSSAKNAPVGVAVLPEDAVTLRTKNCLGKPDFEDFRPEKPAAVPVAPSVPRITADLPETLSVSYETAYPVDEKVAALTDEEAAYLNVGAFSGGGILSVIGEASSHVAGAAGETTSRLEAKGFAPMVMSDGPAGIRVSREYYKDAKGLHGLGGFPESIMFMMPKFMQKMAGGTKKPPKGAEVLEHCATAIPIGTAIAQSWNTDFAELCGDIVGDEMERFGIQLWLAPALNIHRSVLCGRNFEYYSEDPLISGRFAAALTRGVQKHPGRGVTIKHYAANNQETNRYFNNSQVSERAMREIYLKGFGLCVREAAPKAVMTSYNLLNGLHTSEHRGLIEEILRAEFGFGGIVMTDWITAQGILGKAAKYSAPQGKRIAAAGGDLVMPGCQGDYKSILAGLADGTLSRRTLDENATRVLRMAEELCGEE